MRKVTLKIYEGNKALLEQLQIQKALERLIKERAGYPTL